MQKFVAGPLSSVGLKFFMMSQDAINQDALYEFEQLKKRTQDRHGLRQYTVDFSYSTPGMKDILREGIGISVFENRYGSLCVSVLDEMPDHVYVEYPVKFGEWTFAHGQLAIKGTGPKGSYTLTLS